MRILCQLACFYFHLELQRGSISILHVSSCYFSFELHICGHGCIFFSFPWASQQHRRLTIHRHSPVSAQINFPVITSRYPPLLFFLCRSIMQTQKCTCVCDAPSSCSKLYSSLLKNEHPWALRKGKQEKMGYRHEERVEDEQ